MATMTDATTNAYGRVPAPYNNTAGPKNNMYHNHYPARGPAGQTYGMHAPAADMTALAHSFQGLNLNNQSFATQAKNAIMSNAAAPYHGFPVTGPMSNNFYPNAGQYSYPTNYAANLHAPNPNIYTSNAPQAPYLPQFSYQNYQQHDNSPVSQNWTPTTGTADNVPTLITPRRGSVSSNENDQPATPSYASYQGSTHGGVALHRSPSAVYTHGSPSPTSLIGPYNIAMAKSLDLSEVTPHIRAMVAREPAIPRAIPAPSSPLKPLDRALENQRGETNVYIRGLLPETTDEMLEAWGARFGDIKSSKSIIDHNTGLCKGFGFVRYHNYEDAENCIRGFHFLGYEVSFARESFYSKLKTFADECNTNLYVSNLPKSMNEHDLAQLFTPHKVCSSRILRDKNGHGRGVGFARFDSREACEEVIQTFNNHTLDTSDGELQMQIRYADTQEQKTLKQQTQAARQFRSAEYEFATQAWRQGRLPLAGTTVNNTNGVNEFEQYLGSSASVPIQGQRWAQSALRQGPGRSPLSGASYTGVSQQSNIKVEGAGGSEGEQLQRSPDRAADTKIAVTSPATVQATSPVDSVAVAEQE